MKVLLAVMLCLMLVGCATTSPSSSNAANPNIRAEQTGVLGAFSPGSDTKQPGTVFKILTLLAGGGGYEPTSQTRGDNNSSGNVPHRALMVASDGTYVSVRPTLAPDGSYVGGKPVLAPNGKYVGDGSD